MNISIPNRKTVSSETINDLGLQHLPETKVETAAVTKVATKANPNTFQTCGDVPAPTMPPPMKIWSRGRFDSMVESLLKGNASIEDNDAREMAGMLGGLPSSTEAVHAGRALAKLNANNYIKSPVAKEMIQSAFYSALIGLDKSWPALGAFDSNVSDVLSGKKSPDSVASEMASQLKSIEEPLDLIHATRALHKLRANDGLGSKKSQDEITSALYSKMISLAPRGNTGWPEQKKFQDAVYSVLDTPAPATLFELSDISDAVGSINSPIALVFATRHVEKLLDNDLLDAAGVAIVGDAIYQKLIAFDQPQWPSQNRFDEMVSKLLSGNTSARIPEAKELAGLFDDLENMDAAPHAMRAMEKLTANNYFKGEAKEIVENGMYKMLTRLDKPLPVIRPYHRASDM